VFWKTIHIINKNAQDFPVHFCSQANSKEKISVLLKNCLVCDNIITMQLKIKKLNTEAKMPTKGHPGDAGVDLYALEEVVFAPMEQKRVFTGVAMEIPEGCVGLLWDKSSISFNKGLKILGGVIDAGFRGEVVASMVNLSTQEQKIEKGQKFTQIIIQKFEDCELVEIEELSSTVRGEGREGSTGNK
jgi:dUTP pyrophosphatase